MTALPAIPLSVLDLAMVGEGSSHTEALRASVALARDVERLGFRRFWVAEHHNMPSVASSAPPVLIASIAAATETIRVGAGGVMLPNHAPLVVAEQFGTLEALHPGRIDLGIGRAPGTDQITAAALRRSPHALSADDFPEQLGDLIGFLDGAFPPGHPYRTITAVPGTGDSPAIWLLGSSGYSAEVAGVLGLPFAFAHHFMAENTVPALALYRRSFRPSATLAAPYAMIGVQVVCAEDDERARWLAAPAVLGFHRQHQGRPGRVPTPEAAAAHTWSEGELRFARQRHTGQAIGGPDTVRKALAELLEQTQADELMVTTSVHDPADRMRSMELVRELFADNDLAAAV